MASSTTKTTTPPPSPPPRSNPAPAISQFQRAWRDMGCICECNCDQDSGCSQLCKDCMNGRHRGWENDNDNGGGSDEERETSLPMMLLGQEDAEHDAQFYAMEVPSGSDDDEVLRQQWEMEDRIHLQSTPSSPPPYASMLRRPFNDITWRYLPPSMVFHHRRRPVSPFAPTFGY